MLRIFLGTCVTHFALGRDPHELEPGADREALVESEPDENAHCPWAGVVLNFGDGLRDGGVLKVEAFYECDHTRSPRRIPSIVLASFGGVAKERSIPKGQRGTPVPLSWVPLEILDEPGFENPISGRFLAQNLQVYGDFEGRPESLLR
ncbi:unnamed protein product [Sphagnum tenellum]